MVSISLSDVTHDLAVHSGMQHQGVNPTGLNDRLPRNEILESDEGGLGVLHQFQISQKVLHVGVGQLVLQFSSEILLLVLVPVSLDGASGGDLRQKTGLFALNSHSSSDASRIHIDHRLPVLDVLSVEHQNIRRRLLPLLQVKNIALANVAPAETREFLPIPIDF